MRYFARKRAIALAVLALGSCFALDNCGETAQLSLIRVGFSSFTLPLNQTIINMFSLINASIVQAVTGGS